MAYLEDVLKTMKEDTDVMVLLSSESIICFNPLGAPLMNQDSCGNHHAKNWLKAIKNKGLEKVFEVKEVTVSCEYYMEQPQWEVTLSNKKSEKTQVLESESNLYVCDEEPWW